MQRRSLFFFFSFVHLFAFGDGALFFKFPPSFAGCHVKLAGVVCVTPAPGLRLWRRLRCNDIGSTVSRTRNKSKHIAAKEIFRNNAIGIYIHECRCNSLGGARLTERRVERRAHTHMHSHTHSFSTQSSQRCSAKATPHREDDICHGNMPGRAALARVAISWTRTMRRRRRVKSLTQLFDKKSDTLPSPDMISLARLGPLRRR